MNKLKRVLASIAAFGMLLSSVPTVAAMGFKDVSDDNQFAGYIDHGVDKGYFSGANEYFYPNNNLTRGELAKIAMIGAGLTEDTTKGPHFDDVAEDNAFYPYVETLLNKGALSANKTFRPNDKITRAEAAKILVMTFGFEIDTTGGPTFSDVAADNAFYSYIETAANNGLVNGYEDGTFGPYKNITRAEASKILAMATGYTGTWGEAAGVALTLSADTVDVGGTLNVVAKVVDDAGNAVQDYDGVAVFTVSSGNISDKSVDLVRGQAKVGYTAPGYGSLVTMTVKVDKFTAEKTFSVVIPEDQKMMLYSTDYKINGTDKAILYLTLSDDKGMPQNGKASDLTFDVAGDATVTDVAAFPGGADGVYRAILNTTAASVGVNTVTVVDNKTGDTATLDVEVGQPTIQTYLLNSAVSVNQSTVLLVNLTQGDSSPITGALTGTKLTATFLNSELGRTDAVAPVELAAGWYKFTVTAKNRVTEDGKMKVSYTGVTPNVHEYVSLKVAPYDVSVEVTPDDVNMLTGVASVIVTLKDVNGNPVDVSAYDPTSSIGIDVITSAKWTDVNGAKTFGAGAWYKSGVVGGAFNGKDGVLVTRIYACGVPSATLAFANCNVDDSNVQVTVREKTAVNKVIEKGATIRFSKPIVDKIQNFQVTGGYDVLVVSVNDAKGAGITGLAARDGVDGDGALAADQSFFTVYDTTTRNIKEDSVIHVGGGVYIIGGGFGTGLTNVSKLTIGNDDARYVSLGAPTTTAGNYVVMSDNSVSEGLTAAGTPKAGMVATVVDTGVPVSANTINVASDDSGHLAAPTLLSTDSTTPTLGQAIDINGSGIAAADDALVTGMHFTSPTVVGNALSAKPTDQVETVKITTTNTTTSTVMNTSTFSVYPIKMRFMPVNSNTKVTEKAYGYLKAVDQDGRLVDIDSNDNSVILETGDVTVDENGAANSAETAINGFFETVAGTVVNTDFGGVYQVVYTRGINNNDSNQAADIEFQLNADDESGNVGMWKFTLTNPTYDVYVQNDSTYVSPNSKMAAAQVLDSANALFILTVVRDGNGVAKDLTRGTTTADAQVVMEITSGDGHATFNTTRLIQDKYNIIRNNAGDSGINAAGGELDGTGIYAGYYLPEDNARANELAIYTGYDKNNDQYKATIDVVYPTAQVVVYPTKIDPDKQNNEATVLAVVKDMYGNSVPGLQYTTSNPDFSVEIEGDQKVTSSDDVAVAGANPTADTIYYGNYSTNKTGSQKVEVKYNDDVVLQTSEIMVEMINN